MEAKPSLWRNLTTTSSCGLGPERFQSKPLDFAPRSTPHKLEQHRAIALKRRRRQGSLTVLPPFGLQTITVSKTSTPDMDGDAIAGTIDFHTPTAFDFNKPVLRVYGQFGENENALQEHEPSDGQTIQVDAGNVLGSDRRWGVYISGYYTVKNSISEEAENDGEWTPYLWPATDTQAIDYNSLHLHLHLPGLDLDYYRLKQRGMAEIYHLTIAATKANFI
jgi:hypothetical protein